MKWAMVLLDEWLTEANIDYKKIIDMHDEGQLEVREDQAHQAGMLACMAIQRVGEMLGLNCPLKGEYKVGVNWSQTH